MLSRAAKERSTGKDTMVPRSGRRVDDYESGAGDDENDGDDRYGILTTDPIVHAPSVRGYDNLDDYDRNRDGDGDDRRRDDNNYNYDFNNNRDYDDDNNNVNDGSENAKDRIRRRRYGRIYE